MEGQCQSVSQSSFLLLIDSIMVNSPALPLFTSPTLESIRLRLLFRSRLSHQHILFLQFPNFCQSLFTSHFLWCQINQLVCFQFTSNNSTTELRVLLIFEIEREGTHLVSIIGIDGIVCRTEFVPYRSFDL